mmetsp:Transcript_2788/g.8769  ORF Transcript_2788/g.8769 Transcript_2788/m.8769 type:complete len:419 (+) Transcript_2788:202-1458(+)
MGRSADAIEDVLARRVRSLRARRGDLARERPVVHELLGAVREAPGDARGVELPVLRGGLDDARRRQPEAAELLKGLHRGPGLHDAAPLRHPADARLARANPRQEAVRALRAARRRQAPAPRLGGDRRRGASSRPGPRRPPRPSRLPPRLRGAALRRHARPRRDHPRAERLVALRSLPRRLRHPHAQLRQLRQQRPVQGLRPAPQRLRRPTHAQAPRPAPLRLRRLQIDARPQTLLRLPRRRLLRPRLPATGLADAQGLLPHSRRPPRRRPAPRDAHRPARPLRRRPRPLAAQDSRQARRPPGTRRLRPGPRVHGQGPLRRLPRRRTEDRLLHRQRSPLRLPPLPLQGRPGLARRHAHHDHRREGAHRHTAARRLPGSWRRRQGPASLPARLRRRAPRGLVATPGRGPGTGGPLAPGTL